MERQLTKHETQLDCMAHRRDVLQLHPRVRTLENDTTTKDAMEAMKQTIHTLDVVKIEGARRIGLCAWGLAIGATLLPFLIRAT